MSISVISIFLEQETFLFATRAVIEGMIKSRDIIKGRVTSFKNYLEKTLASCADPHAPLELKEELKRLEIRERVSSIREAYQTFKEIQDDIEREIGKLSEAIEYRERFDDDYFQAIAQAESLIVRDTSQARADGAPLGAAADDAQYSQASSSVAQATVSGGLINSLANQGNRVIYKMSGIRLPTIELPKFNGEAAEWLSFRDTFESLIHKNETIDNIQKFHYLRASLEGVAAQIIKSLELTTVNYTVAWETICSRFNNKRLLAHNHIKAIFDIQSLKEESAAKIRETIDTLNKHLLALNALDQSTEHWDALLIYLISTKLDNVTARVWEEERAGNDIPTLSEFKLFLNSCADLLDSLELNNKDVQKTRQNERAKTKALV